MRPLCYLLPAVLYIIFRLPDPQNDNHPFHGNEYALYIVATHSGLQNDNNYVHLMKIIYQYCTYPFYDTKKYFQTELSSKLRLRRGRGDTSEDDEGLPRSPPCGSPAVPTDSFLILEKTVNHKVSNGFFFGVIVILDYLVKL